MVTSWKNDSNSSNRRRTEPINSTNKRNTTEASSTSKSVVTEKNIINKQKTSELTTRKTPGMGLQRRGTEPMINNKRTDLQRTSNKTNQSSEQSITGSGPRKQNRNGRKKSQPQLIYRKKKTQWVPQENKITNRHSIIISTAPLEKEEIDMIKKRLSLDVKLLERIPRPSIQRDSTSKNVTSLTDGQDSPVSVSSVLQRNFFCRLQTLDIVDDRQVVRDQNIENVNTPESTQRVSLLRPLDTGIYIDATIRDSNDENITPEGSAQRVLRQLDTGIDVGAIGSFLSDPLSEVVEENNHIDNINGTIISNDTPIASNLRTISLPCDNTPIVSELPSPRRIEGTIISDNTPIQNERWVSVIESHPEQFQHIQSISSTITASNQRIRSKRARSVPVVARRSHNVGSSARRTPSVPVSTRQSKLVVTPQEKMNEPVQQLPLRRPGPQRFTTHTVIATRRGQSVPAQSVRFFETQRSASVPGVQRDHFPSKSSTRDNKSKHSTKSRSCLFHPESRSSTATYHVPQLIRHDPTIGQIEENPEIETVPINNNDTVQDPITDTDSPMSGKSTHVQTRPENINLNLIEMEFVTPASSPKGLNSPHESRMEIEAVDMDSQQSSPTVPGERSPLGFRGNNPSVRSPTNLNGLLEEGDRPKIPRNFFSGLMTTPLLPSKILYFGPGQHRGEAATASSPSIVKTRETPNENNREVHDDQISEYTDVQETAQGSVPSEPRALPYPDDSQAVFDAALTENRGSIIGADLMCCGLPTLKPFPPGIKTHNLKLRKLSTASLDSAQGSQHGSWYLSKKKKLSSGYKSIHSLDPNMEMIIFSFLEAKDLCSVEIVSKSWKNTILEGKIWRDLVQRNCERSDDLGTRWRQMGRNQGWIRLIDLPGSDHHILPPEAMKQSQLLEARKNENEKQFFRQLYPAILCDMNGLAENFRNGHYYTTKIGENDRLYKGAYSVQLDERRVVCGLKDNTIKIFDREDLSLQHTMVGHNGSVLCLQFHDDFVISGSSDSTVRAWDINTGKCLCILPRSIHRDSVLHLVFRENLLVTCSKDAALALWDISQLYTGDRTQGVKIPLIRQCVNAHNSAINGVDFDAYHIVSASGDRYLKVWNIENALVEGSQETANAFDWKPKHEMRGHTRGIACVQLLQTQERGTVTFCASGGGDLTIRVWDIIQGICLHVVQDAHQELVRSLKFFQSGINKDHCYLASASYDGKVKVWDIKPMLESKDSGSFWDFGTLGYPTVDSGDEKSDKLRLLWAGQKHTSRLFRVYTDEFSIASGAQDGSVLIWNFLPKIEN